ncbi:MAG: crotonase/enoyl-CoA hydratase family protein [Alphaproteobacteria bacterium]|nr:crotonase/enoyl-CoA hydratase family protein [Alphaproteobacteria bacterium]
MSKRVEITITDNIAEVALARPDKMNALDMKMFTAIREAGESLQTVKGLRAVVLYGQGDSFCAGIDTNVFGELIANIADIRVQMLNPPKGDLANMFQKPCFVWQELGVPVIAALQGATFGGGAQLALAADFRIAGPDLRFSIMESKWGLIPDMGLTQNLPKLVRADQAKELMMTARILGADEALAMGLVTRLADDPLAAARAFAADLATRSPEVLRDAKRLVEEAWCAPYGDGMRLEAELQAEIIASPNQVEAVMANVQKRAPNFK